MGNENNAQQITISLEKNHPVFELDAKQRAEKIKDILDDYFSNGQKMKDDLAELVLKVEMLTARMEVLNEVLHTVKEIQKNISHAPVGLPHDIKQGHEAAKSTVKAARTKETLQGTGSKGIRFDVDAFLDLG